MKILNKRKKISYLQISYPGFTTGDFVTIKKGEYMYLGQVIGHLLKVMN